MSRIADLLKNDRQGDVWQLCCGFLDLSIAEFMAVQNNLLLDQIKLLQRSRLGAKLLGGVVPRSVEEFRSRIPLTTYVDYCPELLERREDTLPVPPALWVETSGKGGEYPYKWIPYSHRFWEEAGLNFCAGAIFGMCSRKGEVPLKEGFKLLHSFAPAPFLTHAVARSLTDNLGFRYLPSLEEAADLSFHDTIEKGFNMALSGGIDGFFGLGGVLVAIGERFKQRSSKLKYIRYLRQARALPRLTRGIIKSRRAGRTMMPKDLWSVKFLITAGTDSLVYKDRIRQLWGRNPMNVYGNTEAAIIATQTWDYNDMVFFPNLNYLEFIPEDELYKWRQNPAYEPQTLVLDEVKAGNSYELVITNFHGGALVRYRVGDLVRITSLHNEKLSIDIPQMELEGRTDDLVDLGFMRLTEKVIWQAIENTGIAYQDWTAYKETEPTPHLKLLIELSDDDNNNGHSNSGSAEEVAEAVYQEIKKLKGGLYVYRDIDDLEKLINFKPIEVTLLSRGVFSNFRKTRQDQRARITDLKPPHINAPEHDLQLLGTERT